MKLLDLFSGIGGFHLGLEQAGFEFDYVGFSEIDKYASKQYKKRFPNAKELGSVTDIQCEQLPEHIDILCGGFPCQSFSIAGLRGGFEDTRGTLFFEIVRILQHYKDSGNPIDCFILENVKGLLSHDDGKTFATIYGVLADLDYSVECQLLNTRWFLPQNRERIYIVGHFRGESRRKVFPIGEDDGKINNRINIIGHSGSGGQKGDIHSTNGISSCLSATDYKQPKQIMVADYRTDEGIRIRNDGDAPCLTASHSSENEPSRMQGLVISHNLQQRSPDRPSKLEGQPGGSGPLSKEDGTTYCLESHNLQAVEVMAWSKSHRTGSSDADKRRKNYGKVEHRIKTDEFNTLSTGKGCSNMSSSNFVGNNSSIRRLTPTECERLQGFPDGWTEGQSDTQRYKQLGNAVSVPVVKAVGDKLFENLHSM